MNPHADPTAALATIHDRNRRMRRERLEDARWLADTGEHLTGAAQRLGITRDALEAFLRDHDRDTLARLRAREPRDPNRRPGMRAMETGGRG